MKKSGGSEVEGILKHCKVQRLGHRKVQRSGHHKVRRLGHRKVRRLEHRKVRILGHCEEKETYREVFQVLQSVEAGQQYKQKKSVLFFF